MIETEAEGETEAEAETEGEDGDEDKDEDVDEDDAVADVNQSCNALMHSCRHGTTIPLKRNISIKTAA